MEVHRPPNYMKITELWAFVSSDEGGEGLIAMPLGNVQMPLVGADPARVESLKPYALQLSKAHGVKVKLMRFKLDSVEELS